MRAGQNYFYLFYARCPLFAYWINSQSVNKLSVSLSFGWVIIAGGQTAQAADSSRRQVRGARGGRKRRRRGQKEATPDAVSVTPIRIPTRAPNTQRK